MVFFFFFVGTYRRSLDSCICRRASTQGPSQALGEEDEDEKHNWGMDFKCALSERAPTLTEDIQKNNDWVLLVQRRLE